MRDRLWAALMLLTLLTGELVTGNWRNKVQLD